jgi:hypothetical protein
MQRTLGKPKNRTFSTFPGAQEQALRMNVTTRMKRVISAPNLQIKFEQSFQPENRVLCVAQHAKRSFDINARNLPFAEPVSQGKKKKARRPRLVWTDGLHLRFVLSIVQGT